MKEEPMKRSSEAVRKQRRNFFQQMLVCGGTVILSVMGARRGAGGSGDLEGPKCKTDRSAGYRLTPHIRKYYERAGW